MLYRLYSPIVGTGALSGVLSGVGGGLVIVPALTRFTSLATRSIIATSLAVIALLLDARTLGWLP